MNRRPSGYEPDELPDCSIPRLWGRILQARAVVSTFNSHYRANTSRRSGVQPRRGRCERRGCWLPVRTSSRLYAAPTGGRGAFAVVRRLRATRCLPPTRCVVPVGAACSREEAGVSAGDLGCPCGRLRGCTPLLQGCAVPSAYEARGVCRSGVKPRRGRCGRWGFWLFGLTPSRLYAAPTGVRGAQRRTDGGAIKSPRRLRGGGLFDGERCVTPVVSARRLLQLPWLPQRQLRLRACGDALHVGR